MTSDARHISVTIQRSAEDVYAFVSDPRNLPQWAAGLSGSIENVNGEWLADSPMGKVTVRFAPANSFGVLDHYVTLPTGVSFYNPLRVFPNGDGSECVFTLYRQSAMSDGEMDNDAEMIAADLQTLKRLMESARA